MNERSTRSDAPLSARRVNGQTPTDGLSDPAPALPPQGCASPDADAKLDPAIEEALGLECARRDFERRQLEAEIAAELEGLEVVPTGDPFIDGLDRVYVAARRFYEAGTWPRIPLRRPLAVEHDGSPAPIGAIMFDREGQMPVLLAFRTLEVARDCAEILERDAADPREDGSSTPLKGLFALVRWLDESWDDDDDDMDEDEELDDTLLARIEAPPRAASTDLEPTLRVPTPGAGFEVFGDDPSEVDDASLPDSQPDSLEDLEDDGWHPGMMHGFDVSAWFETTLKALAACSNEELERGRCERTVQVGDAPDHSVRCAFTLSLESRVSRLEKPRP